MLRIPLNVGLLLFTLFGTATSALTARPLDDALQGFPRPARQPTNSVAVQSQGRMDVQPADSAASTAATAQNQNSAQVRQQDALQTATRDRQCQQDHLRVTNRAQLDRKANSRFHLSVQRGRPQP